MLADVKPLNNRRREIILLVPTAVHIQRIHFVPDIIFVAGKKKEGAGKKGELARLYSEKFLFRALELGYFRSPTHSAGSPASILYHTILPCAAFISPVRLLRSSFCSYLLAPFFFPPRYSLCFRCYSFLFFSLSLYCIHALTRTRSSAAMRASFRFCVS